MSIRNIGLCIVLTVGLGACLPSGKKESAEVDWQYVKTENVSVKLPEFMSENSNLNEGAFIQYQNLIKEFYFISIKESKAAFDSVIVENGLGEEYPPTIDGYANFIRAQFSENVDEMKELSDVKEIESNGRNLKYFEAEAKVKGVSIYYNYGFMQGDSTYYQVLSWTLGNKKEKFSTTMLDILKSFHETR